MVPSQGSAFTLLLNFEPPFRAAMGGLRGPAESVRLEVPEEPGVGLEGLLAKGQVSAVG